MTVARTQQPDATEEQQGVVVPDVTEETATSTSWRVILFNDDIHTFDEVIMQLVRATGCTHNRAENLAWQVHTQGKAVVYEGDFEECFRVQTILREIELITELRG